MAAAEELLAHGRSLRNRAPKPKPGAKDRAPEADNHSSEHQNKASLPTGGEVGQAPGVVRRGAVDRSGRSTGDRRVPLWLKPATN